MSILSDLDFDLYCFDNNTEIANIEALVTIDKPKRAYNKITTSDPNSKYKPRYCLDCEVDIFPAQYYTKYCETEMHRLKVQEKLEKERVEKDNKKRKLPEDFQIASDFLNEYKKEKPLATVDDLK